MLSVQGSVRCTRRAQVHACWPNEQGSSAEFLSVHGTSGDTCQRSHGGMGERTKPKRRKPVPSPVGLHTSQLPTASLADQPAVLGCGQMGRGHGRVLRGSRRSRRSRWPRLEGLEVGWNCSALCSSHGLWSQPLCHFPIVCCWASLSLSDLGFSS